MTISSSKNKISYVPDGVNDTYIYDFRVDNATDMKVYLDDVLMSTGYTVDGIGSPTGGDVIFTTPPVGSTLVLLREVPLTQEVDYVPYDDFPANTHEAALDKLTMETQQLQEVLDRAVIAVPSTPDSVSLILPPPDASKIIGWNIDADGLVNYDNAEAILGIINVSEHQTAADGQTVFVLIKFTYIPGSNNLTVYINGVKQIQGESYQETNSSTVTFLEALDAGDFVEFVSNNVSSTASIDAQSVSYTFPTGVPRTVESKLNEVVSVKDFGAVGNGVANDTPAIQTAIDAVSTAGGGKLFFPTGTYLLGLQGVHDGYNYGVMLKDNVYLVGAGTGATILKAAANSNMCVITDDRTTTSYNIGLSGLTIDGNSANNSVPLGHYNLWIRNSKRISIDDLFSLESLTSGVRLDAVTNSMIGTIRTSVTDNVATKDGLHLYDCSYVTIDNVICDSLSDDGLVITAESDDTHDITVNNVITTCPVTGLGGGRGILLNLADSANAVSTQRSIYNIKINNAVTYNNKGAAILIDMAQFWNIDINCSDYGSGSGLIIQVGSSNVTGYVRNSSFKFKSNNSDGSGMLVTIVDGVIEHNSIDLQIYNPADGSIGATLNGDYWTGSIDIDYDPAASKVSPSYALDVFGSYNNLNTTIQGGTNGIYCRPTATYNTFKIGSISDTSSACIYLVAGADNNKFIGGYIDGPILNLGVNTIFDNVSGAYARGKASLTPDASGNADVSHGLQGTPQFINLTLGGFATTVWVDAQTQDVSIIRTRFKDNTGAAVTTGTYTVYWEASL